MGLEKYSITENGETPLHVAASAKGPKDVEKFVKNLVGKMQNEDLELQNKNHNTALYLAVVAGNIKTVKIMVEKNKNLLKIAGANGKMMPLYAAVLFGNKDVVKYLYDNSKELHNDDGWTTRTTWYGDGPSLEDGPPRRRHVTILTKMLHPPKLQGMGGPHLCVVANVPFRTEKTETVGGGTVCGPSPTRDGPGPTPIPYSLRIVVGCLRNVSRMICSVNVALGIVESYQGLRDQKVLQLLARKPEAFSEKKSNFIKRIINSVCAFICLKGESHEKEDYALKLLQIIWGDIAKKSKKEIDDILRGPVDTNQDNKPASGTVEELQKLISGHIVNMHVEIQNNIIKRLPATGNDDQALQLQKLVSGHIAKMHVETQNLIKGPSTSSNIPSTSSNIPNVPPSGNTTKTYSSRIIFLAAETGNTKFIVELIRQYPDLIWKVNDDGLSIFHIAVKHRHEGIYNLLYEIGSMKDLITPLKDQKQNTMLHLVGKSAKKSDSRMSRELLYKCNESYYGLREKKNKDGLTPYELFTKEHKDLMTQGEKWMKHTASQCMVVAALIATIVFAAAFTVPGGYDQDNGIPIFHSKATFMVFVVADAISLFASSASILMFLSILTSRYAERDFLESLPKKLMFGLATLFLSIVTMTAAFSVSFFRTLP
ncbi:putative ankyrin repeat-containing domain, PGG domain, ankyrin repeat-containing domain superfamily [Helianthus annuus]|nr:putative ankyrin repeat-containing domain, PGG domain, ankyrin repeat-containing domain superfamily [Helianthus annuus]KAJ0518133.1 putative ankyrin repeat-containing domain, PGG domain, ankyrin repeat-containing domain superfamily [Helianthus annuus]KAJ0686158.1 putative ankyrin repeat-containing domain, PGG domain, ankyrin repeat-containing domain superfamily [Helianthus annuus]